MAFFSIIILINAKSMINRIKNGEGKKGYIV